MSSRVLRQFALALLVAIAMLCVLPGSASAWKVRTHAYSANLILDEIVASGGTVSIPPYGTFAVDPEVYSAIVTYPKAFRAGAIGPDGYPDIYVGQAYIHPAPIGEDGTYSDQWLQQQWDNVRRMPPGNARKQALAFVCGYLVHASGDLFGHDYINDLSGGEYPALADAAGSIELQNIIARHLVTESYIDSRIPTTFTMPDSEYMKIEAPRDFVVESLMTNGGVDKGGNQLFTEFATGPRHLRAMLHLRGMLTGEIAALTRKIDNAGLSDALVLPAWVMTRRYVRQWRNDVDDAIRGWASTSNDVAQHVLLNDMEAAKIDLREWGIHHAIKMSPFPDIVSDEVGRITDQGDKYASWIPTWVTDQIAEWKADYIYDTITRRAFNMSYEDLRAITGDPVGHLEGTRFYRGEKLFPAGGTKAQMDFDMGFFYLPKATPSEITFAPFHNTVVMGKLVLIGEAGTNELLARAGSGTRISTNPMLGFMRTLDGSDSWEDGRRETRAPRTVVSSQLYDVRYVWCEIFKGIDRGVVNPSFEAEFKADGVPMDWRFSTNAGTNGSVAAVTSLVHDRKKAVTLRNTGGAGNAMTLLTTPFVARPLAVIPEAGALVEASTWVQSGRTPSSVEMRVQFTNGANEIVGGESTFGDAWGVNAGSWKKMSLTAKVPADAVNGSLMLRVKQAGNDAEAVFDDVQLRVWPVVPPLVLYPPPGTFVPGQTVTISCPTAPDMPKTIRYTTDGSEPTAASAIYSGPIRLDAPTTIKASAWHASSWKPSPVATGTYKVTVNPPVLSPQPGTYDDTQTVTITCPRPDATIRYTLDGSVPSSASPLYTGPLEVASPTKILARAFAPGIEASPLRGGWYLVNSSTVLISPAGGAFTSRPVKVTLMCGLENTRIYYSTTGKVPTKTSARWVGKPISLYVPSQFRARALINGTTWGPVSGADFLINNTAPWFAPGPSRSAAPKTVRIGYSTKNTAIYYTTDGSEPTTASARYTEPIRIASTTMLKARALLGGTAWSPLKSGTYTIAYPAPTFSPGAATYYAARHVTIRHPSGSARIFYTTDGSIPTTASPAYSDPIYLDQPTTLKARALLEGTAWSEVRTGVYNIKVPMPTFSPTGGTSSSARLVTIRFATPGAKIYYTTDGSEPDASSKLYTAPVSIASTTTLKARALSGSVWSATRADQYNIRYYAPTISPSGGTSSVAKLVSITHSSPGSVIYYTTDGSEPDATSNVYVGRITVSETLTLKARALIGGVAWSPTRSASFTVNLTIPSMPSFSPSGSTYTGARLVKMTHSTAGAKIYYTTDGSEPGASSALYSVPVSIDTTTTLKARALVGGVWGAVRTAVYNIRYAAPSFSPSGGTYTTAKTVTVTRGTAGSVLYYTLDGSLPTEESPRYTAPVAINRTSVLTARELIGGPIWSPAKWATYTINLPAPTLSPSGGSYTTIKTVTMTHVTAGAQIYYTVDGSDPTEASTLYTAPITVDETLTVKARALIGGAWGAVKAATFSIHYVAPTLSPSGGTYSAGRLVTITHPIAGARLYYTMDGTEPTTASTLYTGPVTLNASVALKARALINGHVWSATKTGIFTIRQSTSAAVGSSGRYVI